LAAKASQPVLLELQRAVTGMERDLSLKADLKPFNEQRQALQQLSGQLPGKNNEVVREALCLATDVQQHLVRKADQQYVDEIKSRLAALELLLSSKAERREMGEVRCAFESLKEDTFGACRTDQKAVEELARQQQELSAKCLQKLQGAEARIQALSETCGRSGDVTERKRLETDREEVATRLYQAETLLQKVIEELQRKADQQSLQDTMNSVAALSAEVLSSSRASVAASHASTVATPRAGGPARKRSNSPKGLVASSPQKGAVARILVKQPATPQTMRSPRNLRVM